MAGSVRVLVTGSREWHDHQTIHDALMAQWQRVDCWPQRMTVVHGGARGADRIANDWAITHHVTREIHSADWARLGKRAGFVRNARMVERGADICLAFILNGSPGATMTADLADHAGISV